MEKDELVEVRLILSDNKKASSDGLRVKECPKLDAWDCSLDKFGIDDPSERLHCCVCEPTDGPCPSNPCSLLHSLLYKGKHSNYDGNHCDEDEDNQAEAVNFFKDSKSDSLARLDSMRKSKENGSPDVDSSQVKEEMGQVDNIPQRRREITDELIGLLSERWETLKNVVATS